MPASLGPLTAGLGQLGALGFPPSELQMHLCCLGGVVRQAPGRVGELGIRFVSGRQLLSKDGQLPLKRLLLLPRKATHAIQLCESRLRRHLGRDQFGAEFPLRRRHLHPRVKDHAQPEACVVHSKGTQRPVH